MRPVRVFLVGCGELANRIMSRSFDGKRIAFSPCVLLLALFSGQAAAHGGEDHSHDAQPASTPTSQQRLADGSLFVPKPTQRRLGLRTQLASTQALAATLTFNGKVIADPNASGRVQAIQSGRVAPGPKGLPVLGQQVRKGEVLAWLKPAASSLERGNQQALLAELEGQFAIAERRVRRLDQLEGALPQKEIEAARFELEALKKRRAAIGASLAAPEPLYAPVSGVISAAHGVAGQVVEAREVLFEVVDPARLAVEALAYEAVPFDTLNDAIAQTPGGNVPLRFVGAGRQLREQAMPLLFRIKPGSDLLIRHELTMNVGRASARQVGLKADLQSRINLAGSISTTELAIGQPVKVIAKTETQTNGVAVPLTALVKNTAGETVVWLHTGAEQFASRVVQWSPLDGDNVAVTTGLSDGDRIVTAGASLLAQMR